MKLLLHLRLVFVFIILCSGTFSCSKQKETKNPDIKAPIARKEPHNIIAKHGHKRVDDYYWLRNREDSAVIDYLKAENEYLDTVLAHTADIQKSLFEELKGRIKEDDTTVPYRKGDYFYYTRYVEGGEYPIYCRKKGSMESNEEILVDGNELSKGKSFLRFFLSTSPNQQLTAIVMDTVGRNRYTIRFKDLNTGEMLPDVIPNTRGGYEWTNDNNSILYTVPHPKTLRNYLVKRHILGQPTREDQTIYEEKDATLDVGIDKTRSEKYFIMSSGRTDANVSWYFSADNPQEPQLINPLKDNIDYYVDHVEGDTFLILTNYKAKNFRLVKAPVSSPSSSNWKDFIPHREDVLLRSAEYFKDYLVLEEMKAGLNRLRIIRWDDQSEHYIDFGEPAYYAGIAYNPEYKSKIFRYNYQSLTTPSSIYDYNLDTREKELRKEQPVLGGFNKDDYASERVMVKARDGQLVPLSIVYRKDTFRKGGANPGWITGYGSYGSTYFPTFSSTRLSLLDRGFVYAIAHVRGGKEMGGEWYEQGKMFNKKNTFFDFVDCSEWLIENGYVGEDMLVASGGSAGGLLMGAIVNLRPELYQGIIASVPFVDVVTTMMDESIPLTTFEWKEWGNPNVKEEYEYMLSYSPYDNVEAKDYPNMLVTTGLHDSQVQYWEPAKWVAKLRDTKTDDNKLLLYTNMEAGHGGASGRFQALKELAMEYAFVFDILEIEPVFTVPQEKNNSRLL